MALGAHRERLVDAGKYRVDDVGQDIFPVAAMAGHVHGVFQSE